MHINPHGIWESRDAEGHVHDASLADALVAFLKDEAVSTACDFGCGMATYAKLFASHGVQTEAYDGNPNTPLLTNNFASVQDLSVPFDLGKQFECVMSLEVGEHIPKWGEETFFNNLVVHAQNLIILSWALVGQNGDGHVNCQDNPYILDQMGARGFQIDMVSSERLRDSATTAPWFRKTIMVFRKR